MGRTSVVSVLVALLAGAASGAPTTGQIHGRVTDKEGNPLEKVVVTLVGPTTTGRPTTTDAAGEFRFYYLDPGNYTVWADEQGPRVAWRSVGVRVGVTSRVILTVRTAADDECENDDPDGEICIKPREDRAPEDDKALYERRRGASD